MFLFEKRRTVNGKMSFNHLVIHLFSQHLLPFSVLGMGNRMLNKTDTFPAFMEHERKRWIINRKIRQYDSLFLYDRNRPGISEGE